MFSLILRIANEVLLFLKFCIFQSSKEEQQKKLNLEEVVCCSKQIVPQQIIP